MVLLAQEVTSQVVEVEMVMALLDLQEVSEVVRQVQVEVLVLTV